ncbi:MAG: nitrite reductase (NAD(P)H), partial [Gammaproteobacteria bacterium]
MQSRRPTLIVIGNGMVGHHLIKTLADNQHINQFKVIVFCEEPHPAYDRVQLSRFFSGFSAEDLVMIDHQAYQQWGVTLMLNEHVVALVIPQPNP